MITIIHYTPENDIPCTAALFVLCLVVILDENINMISKNAPRCNVLRLTSQHLSVSCSKIGVTTPVGVMF